MKPLKPAKGFTLLEVIVALAVLAITVTVILQILSGSSRAAHLSKDYNQALAIAETQLALLVAQDNPVGSDSGLMDDKFRWRTRVKVFNDSVDHPLFDNRDLLDPENIYQPYHYQVSVTWGKNQRQLQLNTIRLGVTQ